MTLSAVPNALVVPTRTVQVNQNGTFVFVIKEDKTVEMRPVDVGPQSSDVTVITKGVSLGETVVTDGQLRLFPGAKVLVKDTEKPDEMPAKKSRKRSESVS
jgi:multidrug efflux system membrane fusion protein